VLYVRFDFTVDGYYGVVPRENTLWSHWQAFRGLGILKPHFHREMNSHAALAGIASLVEHAVLGLLQHDQES
jgi:hypothetical protein